MIVIWPDVEYVGTFCNDGAFTFPTGQAIKAGEGYVVFIKYSILGIADISFQFMYKREYHHGEGGMKTLINPICLHRSFCNVHFVNKLHILFFHNYNRSASIYVNIRDRVYQPRDVLVSAAVWPSHGDCQHNTNIQHGANTLDLHGIGYIPIKCGSTYLDQYTSYQHGISWVDVPNTTFVHDASITFVDIGEDLANFVCFDGLQHNSEIISSEGNIIHNLSSWCGIIEEVHSRPLILYLMQLSLCKPKLVYFHVANYHLSINGSQLRVNVILEEGNDTLQVVYDSDFIELNVYLSKAQHASISIRGNGYLVIKYKVRINCNSIIYHDLSSSS